MSPRTLDRLDDAINPIVVKELRQAVKSRLVVSALLVLLLLQVVILGCYLMLGEIRQPDQVDYRAGRTLFLILQGIMMGVCMLLIPAYAGLRLGAERSDTNVDLLFISTLKPRSIVWGKFLSALILVLLIFSACAPFMTFTYLLRGISIPSILLVLGIDLIAVLLGTQLALFLASVPANLGLKVVLFLLGFLALLNVFYMAMGSSVVLLEEGAAMRMDSSEFWGVIGSMAGGVLTLIGLLFVWSVALVSPASANRALRVRTYTVAMWAVLGAAAGWLTWTVKHPGPVYVWQVLMMLLFSLQVVISINERDRWGPRVARSIPRNGWLRALAFLFYSGAAGGILFGVLMQGLTVALGYALVVAWKGRFTMFSPTEPGRVALVASVCALYVFDYAMTAVLCRRALFGDRLKPVFTWVLMAVLVALGSALPYFVLLLVPNNSLQFEWENTWIILPNPIAAAISAANPRASSAIWDFDWWCVLFTGVWAVLATLACMPWITGQVNAFRPLSRAAAAVKTAAAALPVPAVVADAALSSGAVNGQGPGEKTEAVVLPGQVQEAPGPEKG
jgi:hypothetical protein